MRNVPEIEFLVSSNLIDLNTIPEFQVGMKITNASGEMLPFDISKSELYVNEERSIAWDLTVQNGTIINLKIKPHQSEIIRWPLGDAIFETSGTYELKLVWEDFSQKQTVVVLDE